jgi:predicted porin
VKRSLVCVIALAGCVTAAQAADLGLDGLKDPLPDTLTYKGVTIYGTIDVGYAYQTNGRPLGSVVSGLEFIPFTTTRNYTGQSISTIAHSGLEQSKIGIKVEESIGWGWTAIARADGGFSPLSGELSNGCKSFFENAGVVYTHQSSNADSGRCGQFFNGVAYAGVSNAAYGTLTAGRQGSFQLDSIAAYDPMALSYAFSLLGYSGTNGGSGNTQAARWDNSVKYVYTYGPFHAGAMYANGGADTGMFGDALGFNLGAVYRGFSIDAVYTKEHGVVGMQSAVNDVQGSQVLAANINDNSTFTLVGKYTYEFGGGYKDASPGDKLTFYGGYTHIDQSDPKNPVFAGFTAGGAFPIKPDNDPFTTDRILQFFWTGAKYELPSGWSFTAAYYHVDQNKFVADSAPCVAGGASKSDCAGTFDQVSFLVDYQFSKHFDVYSGVTYARVDDGLASGFPGTPGAKFGFAGTGTSVDTTSFMTGMRMKF